MMIKTKHVAGLETEVVDACSLLSVSPTVSPCRLSPHRSREGDALAETPALILAGLHRDLAGS